jgi:putative DNA primase/helicase
MNGQTIERARGRWRELLPCFGVSTKFLSNRHGPCPLCGGRDRFRFDDKEGSGSYYCNQCGPGTGIVLVQRLNGWTFKEAADAIDEILGTGPLKPPAPVTSTGTDGPENRRAKLRRVLNEATSPDLVRGELRRRGLSVVPSVLHGHPQLTYFGADRHCRGTFPAMIAPVLGPDGSLQALHRTYLADLKPRKKLTTAVDTVRGGAIRLFKAGDVLGVAEGIETAIACHERDGLPVWAVISATILEGWEPPAGVRHVVIYGDHDRNYAGHKAAYTLAARLSRDGFTVDVDIPPEPGTDWLDVHVNERGRAA